MFETHGTCHEVGHIIVARRIGLDVQSVWIENRKLTTYVDRSELDQKLLAEQFAYFAAGAAAEMHCFGRYDPVGASSDQQLILAKGGDSIDCYIDNAIRIIQQDAPKFQTLWLLFKNKLVTERLAAQFTESPDTYQIFSATELNGALA